MDDHHADYYINHGRAEKFPWTIYHGPLAKSLSGLANRIAQSQPAAKVLVIGPGGFSELSTMPLQFEFTCIDIDPRVVDDLRRRKDSRIKSVICVSQTSDLEQFRNFDFIYAKEVIEHVSNPDAYMVELYKALRPGGWLWLSTPNYGYFLLPLLESTILEIIARRSGFSRKHIHPSRYSLKKFRQLFQAQGFSEPVIKEVSYRMALVGFGQK